MTNYHDGKRSTTWICSNLTLAMMLWASRKQNMNPTMIYDIYHSYMKPSREYHCSRKIKVHWDQALHSLWWSPEKRSGSPIYISTDEQISRYFGKASVQYERVCILKKQDVARGDDFLIEKGRDDS